MIGFARIYDCARCRRGGRAHVSFPLGIHPVGQMLARAAGARGIAVNWAGSGTTTPSVLQLELIERLKPTIWMGMSSYGLHLEFAAHGALPEGPGHLRFVQHQWYHS